MRGSSEKLQTNPYRSMRPLRYVSFVEACTRIPDVKALGSERSRATLWVTGCAFESEPGAPSRKLGSERPA